MRVTKKESVPFLKNGHIGRFIKQKHEHQESVEVKEGADMEEEMEHRNNMITLNVGGHLFTTTIETLTRFPHTMFSGMFSDHTFSHTLDTNGAYFIDRDGRHFHEILNFFRCSPACTPESMAQQLSPRALEELKVGAVCSQTILIILYTYILLPFLNEYPPTYPLNTTSIAG